MLVSYVIPVYNMENYIRQCINSIFFQIMIGTDDEIEIIIVNDTDYMTETMKYNRIKYKNVLSGDYPIWLKLLVKLFVRE